MVMCRSFNAAMLFLILLLAFTFDASADTGITKKVFGKLPDNRSVYIYTLNNKSGMEVKVMDWGATIVSVKTPDKTGTVGEVTLGYDTLDEYINDKSYFGPIVGRYANRIAKGKFVLGDKAYALAINNGPNHLHGGIEGFNKKLWNCDATGNNFIIFKLVSKSGDQGYPGKLTVRLRYMLTDDNELIIKYYATTDKTTIAALTWHPYFNLKDAGKSAVLNEQLKIYSELYLPVDSTLIPTGEMLKVEGTPFDFGSAKEVGKDISTDNEQLKNAGGGYDHCWIIKGVFGPDEKPRPVLELYDPDSGRIMTMFSNEPALQIYSGNYLSGTKGRGGIIYPKYGALVIEAEHLPDSPNEPIFPSVILNPGEEYKQTTIYRFSVKK